MSGPLASWCLAHTVATNPSERFVLSMLALRANPDGTNASLSIDQLEALTGYHPATVTNALATLRATGELILVRRGSGRGQISRHRIRIRWCDDDEQCVECAALGKALSTGLTSANNHKGSPETRVTGKGSSQARVSRKGSSETPKGSHEAAKGSSEATPYGNGDGPPSGGTVPHPESAAAHAPDGAASDPGLSDANRAALAAFHEAQRQAKIAKAIASQASSGSDARPVSAAAADARQAAPDPAARPTRRRRRGRAGHRGREPPGVCVRSTANSRSPPWPITSVAGRSTAVPAVCGASRRSCQPTSTATRPRHAARHSRSRRPYD